jgi:predicted signal transduction protein with EAL and GGDEF domain
LSVAGRDGAIAHTQMRWTLVPAGAGADAAAPAKILVISSDISERKNAEARVHRLAFFDPLTDLPNRARLLDALHHALLGSARTSRIGALMFSTDTKAFTTRAGIPRRCCGVARRSNAACAPRHGRPEATSSPSRA